MEKTGMENTEKGNDAYIYPNKDDFDEHFWKNNYLVSIGVLLTLQFRVNANCEQDALDCCIDYIQEHFPGLIMPIEEESNEEYLDEYIYGGNNCRYLNIGYDELHIKTI
jgi:hypothetical protein